MFIQKQKLMRISHQRDESLHDLSEIRIKAFQKKEIGKNSDQNFRMASLKQKERKQTAKFHDLQVLISKHKVNAIKNGFIEKMRLNSVYRVPHEGFESQNKQGDDDETNFDKLLKKMEAKEGLALGNIALSIWSFVNIIQITTMVFIFSVMMIFPETRQSNLFFNFRIFSLGLYVIDMVLNFITKRFQQGKSLNNIRQTAEFYVKNGFFIDLSSIVIFLFQLIVEVDIMPLLTIMALIKLWNNLQKFQKFQYIYINTSGKEQYFGLVKVLLMNFAIGHFLSILLNSMATLDGKSNWHVKLSIQSSQWFIKYIWGYYWGTNIMLTVGFGDLVATNYQEAIILIFIETFSCITLAYNISYVGALIGSIREKNEEKKKKLKYFHRMCQQNQIENQLETKVTNFIQESYQIKKNFEYDEYDAVLESLPQDMQLEYRKEANKILFDGLGFLNYLSKRSMLKMAEVVERRICHPDEIVLKKGCKSQFVILQKGRLEFVCKTTSPNSKLNGKTIEVLEVDEKGKPKIISLDFLKGKALEYDVKSEKYSIIYTLSEQRLKDALRNYEIDYQLFCLLKDRNDYLLDEHCLYPCSICKEKYHNKFECPKLHFRPLRQMVIMHNIHKNSKVKAERRNIPRIPKFKHQLRDYKFFQQAQQLYVTQNLEDDDINEIQKISNFNKTLKDQGSEKKIKQEISEQKVSNPKYRTLDERTFSKIELLLADKNKETNFWDLQTDEAFNFKYYFWRDNPEKFEKSRKMMKLKKKK